MSSALSPTERLLMLLDGVRRSGPGWRADCPRGHSSRGTLSIAEADTGAVLLHCFAGCTAAEIVEPLGLSLSALFPPRPKPQSEADRKANRDALALAGARAGAVVLCREALVIHEIINAIRNNGSVPERDLQRLAEAHEHIDATRLALAREVRS